MRFFADRRFRRGDSPPRKTPRLNLLSQDLEDALKERGVAIDRHDPPSILLFRADSKGGEAVLAEHHLEFDSAMHDEGYVIAPAGARTLAVIAETPPAFSTARRPSSN